MEMKKTGKLIAAVAAATAIFAGCASSSVPTVEQMAVAAKSVGAAAGLVANAVKIEAGQRATVREIVADVQKCVPATNQTFAAAWTPIATEKTAKLVEVKKLTDAQANVVLAAFGAAVDGIDYLFSVKYPAAKTQAELVNAAASSFCEGFLATFKADDAAVAAAPVEYDTEAYKWLVEKRKSN